MGRRPATTRERERGDNMWPSSVISTPTGDRRPSSRSRGAENTPPDSETKNENVNVKRPLRGCVFVFRAFAHSSILPIDVMCACIRGLQYNYNGVFM